MKFTIVLSLLPNGNVDPVHFDKADNKWYYFEDNWAVSHGPFDTKQLARYAHAEYIAQLTGQEFRG